MHHFFLSDKLDNNRLEFVFVFFPNECSFMLVQGNDHQTDFFPVTHGSSEKKSGDISATNCPEKYKYVE